MYTRGVTVGWFYGSQALEWIRARAIPVLRIGVFVTRLHRTWLPKGKVGAARRRVGLWQLRGYVVFSDGVSGKLSWENCTVRTVLA